MLLAIDKEKWITSYDVIRRLKRVFPKEKIGHSGTLDPLATGLLIVWIGKSSKLLGQIQWLDKEYQTTIDFSQMSDTRDIDYWEKIEQYGFDEKWINKNGEIIAAPNQLEIEEKLSQLIPEKELPLTPFSAKKINWKKMYELARSGQTLTETRIMKCSKFEIISYDFPILKLRLAVWSGTYIRSIWYRTWQEFGLWWILTELRRNKIWWLDLNKLKMKKIGNEWVFGAEILLENLKIDPGVDKY